METNGKITVLIKHSYLTQTISSLPDNCHHFKSKDLINFVIWQMLQNILAAEQEKQDILMKLHRNFLLQADTLKYMGFFFSVLMPFGVFVNTLPPSNPPLLGPQFS